MTAGAMHNGYVLIARSLDESVIAHAAPCTRELFHLCIRRANFRDRQWGGRVIRRGQWATSYRDIQEALHWTVGFRKITYSKAQIEASMKMLRRGSMITTSKTTRGLLITVVNYDTYQRPDNYEGHTEDHGEDHNKTTHKEKKVRKEKNTHTDGSVPKHLVDEFVAFWNSRRSLPRVVTMNSDRIDKLQARRKEAIFVERWREAVTRLSCSYFHTGGGKRGWRADVDWFLSNNTNPLKCLEMTQPEHHTGGLDDRQTKQAGDAGDIPVEVGPDGKTARQRALEGIGATHAV